jgi:hypothetical protein
LLVNKRVNFQPEVPSSSMQKVGGTIKCFDKIKGDYIVRFDDETCHAYLFDNIKGIAKHGFYFCFFTVLIILH